MSNLIFSTQELDLIRQWYNSLSDVNANYLIPDDFAVYKKIMDHLDMRISSRDIQINQSLDHEVLEPIDNLNDTEKQTLLAYRTNWQDIYDGVQQGLNSIEIGMKLNLDSSGIRRIIRQMRKIGVLPPDQYKEARELEKSLLKRKTPNQ